MNSLPILSAPVTYWSGVQAMVKGNKARRKVAGMAMAKAGFALLESIHEEITKACPVPDSSFGFRF